MVTWCEEFNKNVTIFKICFSKVLCIDYVFPCIVIYASPSFPWSLKLGLGKECTLNPSKHVVSLLLIWMQHIFKIFEILYFLCYYIHKTIAISCYTDVLSAQFCSKKNQNERQELLLVLWEPW